LRKKARVQKKDFEKALEKLWIHGGVCGVPEERLVRGSEGWRAPYAAQRRLRVEQLARMAEFAERDQCRMLALVQHFGDQQDSGKPCGVCDVCAPAASIKERRPSAEKLAASSASAVKSTRRGKRRRASQRGSSGRGTPRRVGARRGRRSGIDLPSSGPSAALVAALRAWRLQESKQKRVPAFRVLTNRALVAIAEARPVSTASLKCVAGVGPKLLRTYGERIVQLCLRGPLPGAL
jgi:superfamily II DNA helicase RecQ